MLKNLLVLALASFAFGQDDIPTDATVKDEDMGPAAFMWPPDRVWSGDMDNKAPCGSRASAGNRTNFPMSTSASYSFVLDTIVLLENSPTLFFSWRCCLFGRSG